MIQYIKNNLLPDIMDNGWTRLGDLCENSCKENIKNFTIDFDHNKNESIILDLLSQGKITRKKCIITPDCKVIIENDFKPIPLVKKE